VILWVYFYTWAENYRKFLDNWQNRFVKYTVRYIIQDVGTNQQTTDGKGDSCDNSQFLSNFNHARAYWDASGDRPRFATENFTNFCRASSYASCGNSVCPSVRLSVCLSVCHTRTADILVSHKRAITLVFWHQQWLVPVVGGVTPPSVWNLRSNWPTHRKKADFDRYPLITYQP